MECKGHLFLVLVLEGLVGFIEPFNFSFFGISGLGTDLDHCDIAWFALQTNRDHFVIFRLHPSTAFWTLFLTVRATPFLLRDSFLQ